MRTIAEKLARFIQRHPVWIIIVCALLSAAAIPGITMLEPETGFTALISDNDKVTVDTARYEAEFGGESINVLLTGDIADIFSGDNLAAFTKFEQSIMADPQFRTVTGPLSILNIAVEEAKNTAAEMQQQLALAQEQAAQEARDLAAAAGLDEVQQEAAADQAKARVLDAFRSQMESFAEMGELSVENPVFVASVLYDGTGAINPAFSSFIPDNDHVLLFVTPEGNLDDATKLELLHTIKDLLDESGFSGIDPSLVSFIEIVDAIAVGLSSNLTLLLGLSVLVMIIILFFLFQVRWRLLSLVMVGISALWTFGLMGYLGVPLTMTSMAVLPILIGLGIDFSIQFHNRYQEELARTSNGKEAVVTSISRMMPLVGIALLATIIGFITLFISKVPMIKDFGMVLAIGIVISYLVGLFLLHSVVIISDRKISAEKLRKAASKANSRAERVLNRFGKLAIEHTRWVFAIAIIFAVAGGVVDHMLPVNTDYEQLMPQDDPALQELREFRDIVGVGGSISFLVESDKTDSPEVLAWMDNLQEEIADTHPEIVSVNSPAVIVSQATGGVIPQQEQIDAILRETPDFSREKVISDDGSMAVISFAIEYIPVEDIHDLIEEIKEKASPPEGVAISPVGSMVIGAKTMDAIVGSRMTMNFICLGAIFLILLVIYRKLDRTLFCVVPVAAIIAWSSLDMFLIGIPLNPLTSILGVIVIGICTEFMVLLTGRYEEEKSNGLAPDDAMVTAISRIGRAIATTAMTTLGGFGILIASNFVLIRDFGIVTLAGVCLCLIMAMAVMPGIIVWYDKLKARRIKGKTA